MPVGVDKFSMADSFSRAAREYDDWAVLQRRISNALFTRLSGDIREIDWLLDLGSGTGYCLDRLKTLGSHVLALDIALPMLYTSRQRCPVNTSYVCADAERLPLCSTSVDLVYSNLAIQWCEDLDSLFSEIARVLMPGGRLHFSSFGPATLKELRAAWAVVDGTAHVNSFLPGSEVRSALLRQGFSGIEFDSELIQVEYDSVMDLMRELKGIGAHNVARNRLRGLTGKQRFSRMLSAYQTGSERGTCLATYEVYYISACAG